MECNLIEIGSLNWSSRLVYSTKLHPKSLLLLSVEARWVKRSSSKPLSKGLQNDSGKELSRMLRTESAILGIEKKANSKRHNNLWPKAILEALDDAIKKNNCESALKIFGLLRKQYWYQPRCQTYTKLLMMLGKCRQADEASVLFETLLLDGLKPTIDVYTALASAYGESGFIEKAFSVVDDMKTVSQCKPDVYTYSILIKCCAKAQRLDLIESVLAEMTYLGIECSTVTYNIVIDGYGKAEMFDEMEVALANMIESSNGCLPDVFTMNSIVAAYGKCGLIEMMEKWYDEFQLMGIRPDITTFNILIRSYGKAGMYDKMDSIMVYMKRRFFSPTVVTYNIIIEVYGKVGNVDKMDETFKTMKHLGMKPNTITYCSLVRGFSRAGKLEKVDSIMRQVDNSDVVLDTTFFNCAISAYGQAGNVEKMSELLISMKERGCRPDHITFATVAQTYDAVGMREAAEDVVKKLQ
ncbi:unnamed protein product [Rhodiola kirilowii]